ncbi:hypothetical protein [Pseudomonas fluorescens]|uniref:Uncharacterized protein n=1 Tax=Pseudomonas fluorescens TaxID=294 RepID=A0A423MLA8_PSEFL|nr:hypothetical protein [Pseudomonas fluorescens]RON85351.1 hypothetical protein BK670_05480 [Pseudomonas fluorescens]
MDYFQFEIKIMPLLKGYTVTSSKFAGGDFGDLERVELEGFGKLATVEFWSEGWTGFDIYDCTCDEQVMNILVSPEEGELISNVIEEFVGKLNGKAQ